MIIFSNDLLFIHNPKTAGTSLIRYFADHLPGPVFQAGVREIGTHHPHLSHAMTYAQSALGTQTPPWKVIVSVLRDPLERERSMYLYYRTILAVSPTLDDDLPDARQQEAVRQAANLSFPDWLVWQSERFGHCDLWDSRFYYKTDRGDYPSSLRVLRIEDVDQGVVAVLAGLGVSAPPPPRLNVTKRDGVELDAGEHGRTIIRDSYRWMETLPNRIFVRP